MSLKGIKLLITGGTGSFGQWFTHIALREFNPEVIRIFSRDELKQLEMRERFGRQPRLRYLLGDVRDAERLQRAMADIDLVIHAAALKQVPACEYNPFEAVKTNILGAQNVVECALNAGVGRVLALSTDKAVNPLNLYGATKLCAEKIFINGNAYAGTRKTRFACVRYGNVIGSRGSVVPIFERQKAQGVLSLTDRRMTRFWLTLDQAVQFVARCSGVMLGGEVFVPKIPSMRLVDLAEAIAPGCRVREIGIRPGEKIHECLVNEHESRYALGYEDYYLIRPLHKWHKESTWPEGQRVPEGFSYRSDTNTWWLAVEDLKRLLRDGWSDLFDKRRKDGECSDQEEGTEMSPALAGAKPGD